MKNHFVPQTPRHFWRLALLLAVLPAVSPAVQASNRPDYLWVEGEDAASAEVSRHPWWYDKVQTDKLSGGDFISHFTKEGPGVAEYVVDAPEAGEYTLWVRANPASRGTGFSVNNSRVRKIDFKNNQLERQNIAEDRKPDLRFIAWAKAGKVELVKGENVIAFRFNDKDHHHGSLDAFVLSMQDFMPQGLLKPDEIEKKAPEAENDAVPDGEQEAGKTSPDEKP